MSKTTFIYALCEPGTRTVKYIGKSKHPKQRFTEHLRESATFDSYLGHWLLSLSRRGEVPNMVILSEVPMELGDAEEIRYIAAARNSLGMRLVNATDGGDGLNNPSRETREKLRRAITPERAEFIGALNRGKRLSQQERKNISIKNTGRKLTPEQCKAGADARRNKKHPGSSSRFIGVFKNTGVKFWVAEIRVNGKKVHLGCFPNEEEAARARDEASLKYFGPEAKLNFPAVAGEVSKQ